jgi:hypothetical protein
MKTTRLLSAVGLIVISHLLLPAAGAVMIVAPNGLENTEGNSNNCFPFTGCSPIDRYQQVFDSSQFAALPQPELITEIAIRPDAQFGTAGTVSFSNVMLSLSTTSAAPDALSSSFAANIGADATTVYSGALTLTTANTGPAAGPRDFDVVISFLVPFLYDPSAGNLLLEFRNFGTRTGGNIFDATNVLGDGTSRVYAFNDPNAATGNVNTLGFVARFGTQPAAAVAEPGMLALLGLILLAAGAILYRRNR